MKKSILIADDDPSMLKLYARIFSGQNYTVTLAQTVQAASAFIEAHTYDLLITDLMFPDGVGTELIRLFSKKSTAAKSLLVSGSLTQGSPPDLSEVFACLGKPLELDVFMAAVKKALV